MSFLLYINKEFRFKTSKIGRVSPPSARSVTALPLALVENPLKRIADVPFPCVCLSKDTAVKARSTLILVQTAEKWTWKYATKH